ncbi:MAG: hypothetical protein O7C59_09475 [Rickettsia endosymbiont of Ixodes persulcatus]|nr:hypothetical protein [Rickettsia endosymbiont of Ixodes persulcatus]MCZ6903471.1 hypothetical protein [Rickettsia endosymbiont of Ixodes persulcatus]MCZ6909007.1 hypothetical protein [Rickettsia endosymbiont of Ixodes persulcatus]MCZ6910094.1 hypothetical protein [Rickettsia endosymbiont of Ixodes persulcatus]MCZ6914655.1 hypothetical protein [Rickettsia endosymbiont of Ixodes persulcatus]
MTFIAKHFDTSRQTIMRIRDNNL